MMKHLALLSADIAQHQVLRGCICFQVLNIKGDSLDTGGNVSYAYASR